MIVRMILILLCLMASPVLAQQSSSLNLSSNVWTLAQGIGYYGTTHNTIQPDGTNSLAFTFQTYESGIHDGYLTTQFKRNQSLSLSTTQTLKIRVRLTVLSGNPIFRYDTEANNTCVFPAHFRPYFASGKIYGPDYTRWWSNPIAVELSATTGEQTIYVPLTPDNWSGLYGERASDYPAQFAKSLCSINFIGATMGGGCFFGHGVSTQYGTAMFEVLEYSIF